MTQGPWIFPDELIYSELAKSFAFSAQFKVYGEPFHALAFGPLYPVLIAPFFRLAANGPQAYALAKVFDAVVMSSAAVPAYLLARRFLQPRFALLGAGATVLLPSMVYATKLMTESVAFPIFLWTVLAMCRALEQPNHRRFAIALLLIGAAALARAQMVALLPAFLSARMLYARLARSPNRPFRWSSVRTAITVVIAIVIVSPFAFSAAARERLLGNKEEMFHQFRLIETPKWLLYHLAELDLAVTVIPLAAFAVMALLVLRGKLPTSRSLDAFIAVSTSSLVWLLVLVSVYASQPKATPVLYERYLFYVQPLILFGFLAWVQQGVPRIRGITATVALAAGALPVVLPFRSFLVDQVWGVNSATPGLASWAAVGHVIGNEGALLTAVILCVSGLAALSFARARPEGVRVMLLIVLFWLASGRLPVERSNFAIAGDTRSSAFGTADTGWVDASVGSRSDVKAVFIGAAHSSSRMPFELSQTIFWNNSISHAYRLNEPLLADLAEPKLQIRANVLYRSGRPLAARYVVVDRSARIDGIVVTQMGELALLRTDGVVRLRASRSTS